MGQKLKRWLLLDKATGTIITQSNCVQGLPTATIGQEIISAEVYKQRRAEQYESELNKRQLKLF